jgi:hypothetical protein
MTIANSWRLARVLTVAQAALLLSDIDPANHNGDIETNGGYQGAIQAISWALL